MKIKSYQINNLRLHALFIKSIDPKEFTTGCEYIKEGGEVLFHTDLVNDLYIGKFKAGITGYIPKNTKLAIKPAENYEDFEDLSLRAFGFGICNFRGQLFGAEVSNSPTHVSDLMFVVADMLSNKKMTEQDISNVLIMLNHHRGATQYLDSCYLSKLGQ